MTSRPSLLADLTLRLAHSPEDVATEGLTLILGRCDAARHALNTLIAQWTQSAEIVVSRWKSQVVGLDESRTDMEGEDSGGALRVIVENKFWAGLTPNQPTAYLKRLPAENGVLAFVVPTGRLTMIETELLERAATAGFGRLEFQGNAAGRVAKVSSSSHNLVITSWNAILTTIASAVETAPDHNALADIRQLQGLVERMDTEGFVPFSATDMTGPTPRVILQCYNIVDEVTRFLARDPFVNRQRLSNNVGAGWYGPNFRFHGFGCSLMFWAQRWKKFGISPIWLRVATSDWKLPERLHGALSAVLPDPSWLREEVGGAGVSPGLWFPLRLVEGRELEVVVADVMRQIGDVAKVLQASSMSAPILAVPVALGTSLAVEQRTDSESEVIDGAQEPGSDETVVGPP